MTASPLGTATRPPRSACRRRSDRTAAVVTASYLLDAIKAVGPSDVALLLVDQRPFRVACRDERERCARASRRAALDQLATAEPDAVRDAVSALGVVVFPRGAYSRR